MPKTVLISVSSDLVTDQRVHRTASTLKENGYLVLVVGRKLHSSMDLPSRRYRFVRLKLLFEKGPLFYITFNIRLFRFLLKSNADIFYSNDLDTLLANYLASKIKRKPLIYDSHEYFTGVPELENRPFIKGIWKRIERWIVPKLKNTITVNDSIADLYKKEYDVDFLVIRNMPPIPFEIIPAKDVLRTELGLPQNLHIVIMQGAGINIQRGAEEAVAAMEYLSDTLLLIVGGGDVIPQLKKYVLTNHLNEKVKFVPKQSYSELLKYTAAADLGLSLDKDTNINYRFSLPNKIFDYIQAGIPVLASDLPEVKKIVEGYKVGCITTTHDPELLAVQMQKMLTDTIMKNEFQLSINEAAKTLNWNYEKEKLLKFIRNIDW